MGSWIDGLTDEQRDRIVQGQGWCVGDIGNADTTCLIGHAAGECLNPYMAFTPPVGVMIACRFDILCDRFGLDRVVRACKMRAAATTSRMMAERHSPDHGLIESMAVDR